MLIQQDPITPLNLKAVNQLGIIVKNIDRSLINYRKLMNIRSWYRAQIIQEDIYYKNRRIDLKLDVAVGYSGRLQLELIEVLQGEENIYTELINNRGEGLHHIGFMVSNIQKKTEALKKSGLIPVQHGFIKTKGRAEIRFAYFDTVKICGYILELIETKLFGINVGQSHFMIRVGRLMGDVETL